MAATTNLATDTLRLAEEFPPVSTEAWESTIRADLAGADYDKKLIWRTEEGISVRPYYRAEDFPTPRQPLPFGASRPAVMIDAARFGEAGATTVQELGFGIREAVKARSEGAARVGFVLSVGSNFFFEIAKLRACRLLWAELTGEAVYIEARTSLANKSAYDRYTNLLRATTEAMSARIGGADEIHVQAFGFSERLALNVDRMLTEEAHLASIEDPAAGAYYVEVLTDSIAAEARKVYENAAKTNIDEAVAASRAAKEKALASRRKVMVGVNNYPDITETLRPDEVQTPVGGSAWRAASVFEEIRLRSDRHALKTGKRPTVLLLQRGDLKMRQARAQFVQNFFGCGGFAIVESDQFQPAADLVVLCSSDPEYPALAQEICPQSKVPVIVAGNPKEQMEALNAAGVAGYVHILSNAVETLTHWQDKLGIGEGE